MANIRIYPDPAVSVTYCHHTVAYTTTKPQWLTIINIYFAHKSIGHWVVPLLWDGLSRSWLDSLVDLQPAGAGLSTVASILSWAISPLILAVSQPSRLAQTCSYEGGWAPREQAAPKASGGRGSEWAHLRICCLLGDQAIHRAARFQEWGSRPPFTGGAKILHCREHGNREGW